MVHFYSRLATFVCGVFLGFIFAKSFVNVTDETDNGELWKSPQAYSKWFANQGFIRTPLPWDTLRYNKTFKNVIESDILQAKINILCVVLVRNDKNIEAVKTTWAKSCNEVKFVHIKRSLKPVPIKRSKENSSWVLLCQMLIDLTESFDWILVVNDTTFVIMENLRYYLAPLNPNRKYYLGYTVLFWSTLYNSGQAGYVLSKGSLAAFKDRFARNDCSKNSFWNREDFYLGKHLAMVNVTPSDTRDYEGLSRFHPYSWSQVFFPGESYYKTSVFPTKCCSRVSISFQAIQGDKMYTFHYLLYMLQIFTQGHLGNKASSPFNEGQVWKNFLREQNIPDDNITNDEYYKIWEKLIEDPISFTANLKREEYSEYD